jgi:TrmH family RNA methyltransferase
MTSVEVAVMEPKYQVNLGYIARVSKNFGVKRLLLINPRCNYKGKESIKYSKHAHELLENAKILKSLKNIEGSFIIGTTGIWHKTGEAFYNIYNLNDVSKLAKAAEKSGGKITLLLGRDDTGLSKEELRSCDATVFLETNDEYPILNISHALAIMLHGLNARKQTSMHSRLYADAAYQKRIFNLFESMVKNNPKIRDKKSVNMAFHHIIRRSMPTKKEINALSIALAPGYKQKTPKKGR